MLTTREDDAEEMRRLERLSRGFAPSPRPRGITMRNPASVAAPPVVWRTFCMAAAFLFLVVIVRKTAGQYHTPRIEQASLVADKHVAPRADGRCTTLRRLMRKRTRATDDFATCDPSAAELPCCSAMGHCGSTADHCECIGCIDYRNAISPKLSRKVARAWESAQRGRLPAAAARTTEINDADARSAPERATAELPAFVGDGASSAVALPKAAPHALRQARAGQHAPPTSLLQVGATQSKAATLAKLRAKLKTWTRRRAVHVNAIPTAQE